jgi:integrase
VTEYEIRRDLMSRWGDKPITDISKRDVVTFVDAIVDRGAKGQAHNLFGHARAIFNWAINRGIYGLEASPCDRFKPAALIGERGRRQRVLSDAELCAVWKSSEGLGHPYGPLVRLLIITGQRKSDAAKAEWGDIDLENRLWTIPQERHKSGSAHMVPLSDDAVALISSLPRFECSTNLFSVDLAPLNGFSSAKEKLDRLVVKELGATPEGWVFHDLRRTVRTRLSSLRDVAP